MHEESFGFSEQPFGLTPDPKYLYKSQSHAVAFDLLQFAIRRREGFVVVTGDIGTGKTTLCRAILDQLDRKTVSALVLNPFLSDDDLLRLILQDFGVVSRDELKRGRLMGVGNQDLIDTLNEFLLSLQPLHAGALLIIDEAQNLPHRVLEQIRILSNLETRTEKLLQIVLVGQLSLNDLLRSPELRQLDQRVSIRYELKPLTREETSAYVAHRLTIAGGSAVSFAPKALDLVHRCTNGIPRLINLVCDRALLDGYSARTCRVTPGMVTAAAKSLDLLPSRSPASTWVRQRASAFAAGAALMAAVGAGAYGIAAVRSRNASSAAGASAPTAPPDHPAPAAAVVAAPPETSPAASVEPPPVAAPPARAALSRASAPVTSGAETPPPAELTGTMGVAPAEDPGRYSVLVGSFRQPSGAATLSEQLRALGYRARTDRVESGERGTWYLVLAGPYVELDQARQDETRVRQLPGYSDAHLIMR